MHDPTDQNLALLRALATQERRLATGEPASSVVRRVLEVVEEASGCTSAVVAVVPTTGPVDVLALHGSAWNAATTGFFDELSPDVTAILRGHGLLATALRDRKVLVDAPAFPGTTGSWPTHMVGIAVDLDGERELVVGLAGDEAQARVAFLALDDLAAAMVNPARAASPDEGDGDATTSRLAEAIVDTMHDAVINIEPFGEIRWVNPATERLFGYRAEEMIGESVKRLVEEGQVTGTDVGQHGDLHTGQQRMLGDHGTLFGRRKDGTTFPMEVTVSRGRFNQKPLLAWIARDLSDLRQAEDERGRLVSVLEASPDVVAIAKPDGEVTFLNRTGRSTIGGRPSPHLRLADLHTEEGAEFLERVALPAAAVNGSWRGENRLRRGSGEELEVLEVIISHNGDPARPRFLSMVAHDIQRLKEVERLKDEFVSNVSHELRTPLTSIRGALGLLVGGAMGELTADVHQLLTIGLENTERLVRLVNDILDLNKMDAGRLEVTMTALDLSDVVETVLRGLQPSADQLGVTLDKRVDSGLLLTGDADRLVQVFTNLVGNAIKFSPRNSTVRVTSERIGTTIRISVIDEGVGIDEAAQARIFDRFEQVQGVGGTSKGGTGLGLAIARGIVETHGGEIGLRSVPGAGSEFFVELESHG